MRKIKNRSRRINHKILKANQLLALIISGLDIIKICTLLMAILSEVPYRKRRNRRMTNLQCHKK